MDKNKQKKSEEKVEEQIQEDKKEKTEDEKNEFEEKYKRALADYQNLEKRVLEERKEWIISANKELILRLLPILDTLDLAYKHINDQGLRVSINQFLGVLKNEGVERIKTVGEEFDPVKMECIDVAQGEENKVIEEVRSGYMLNDKVIRAAQVRVGEEKADKKEAELSEKELQKEDHM